MAKFQYVGPPVLHMQSGQVLVPGAEYEFDEAPNTNFFPVKPAKVTTKSDTHDEDRMAGESGIDNTEPKE